MFPLQTSQGSPPSSRDSLSISKSISDNGTLANHYVLSRRWGTQAWKMAEGWQDRVEADDSSSRVNGEAGKYFVAHRI